MSSEEMELRAESETEMETEEEKYETESETAENKKTRKKTKKLRKRKGGNSSGVVRWENFLRRMRLRVLLIEADDSTRQIIGALLRKCSYRGQYLFLSFSIYMCVCVCACLLACFAYLVLMDF